MAITPHECKPGCYHGTESVSIAVSPYPAEAYNGLTPSDTQAIRFTRWMDTEARERGAWILSFREYLWSAWQASANANRQSLC